MALTIDQQKAYVQKFYENPNPSTSNRNWASQYMSQNNWNPEMFKTTTTAPTTTPNTTTPTITTPTTPTTTTPNMGSTNTNSSINIDNQQTANPKQWNLSAWNAQGNTWSRQPILTIDGKEYRFNTPDEYINALQQEKSRGAQGNIDQLIQEFNSAKPEWNRVNQWEKDNMKPLVDIAAQQGVKVTPSTNPNKVFINGIETDTGELVIRNGQYMGISSHIQSVLDKVVKNKQSGITSTSATNSDNIAGLRETAEQQGLKVGWDATTGTVTINGVPISTNNMKNENGRYTGTQQEVQNQINLATSGYVQGVGFTKPMSELRQTLSQQGIQVGYDEKTGQVTANGQVVDTSKMPLSEGRYYIPKGDEQKYINLYRGNTQVIDAGNNNGNPNPPPNNNLNTNEDKSVDERAKELAPQLDTTNEDLTKQVSSIMSKIPEYKSPITAALMGIVESITNNKFDYNPDTDPAFQAATKTISRKVMEQMNARGVLNSTITQDKVTEAIGEQLIEYQKFAYERYQDGVNNMLKQADLLGKIDDVSYRDYQSSVSNMMNKLDVVFKLDTATTNKVKENYIMLNDARNTIIEQDKLKLEKKEKEFQKQKDRVEEMGYVDNEASIVLGIPVNTPSQKAREIAEERLYNIKKAILDSNNKINEAKEETKRDLVKIQATQDIKDAIELKKNQAISSVAKIRAELSKYTPDEALQILNNQYSDIQEVVGADGAEALETLIKDVQKSKVDAENEVYDRKISEDASARGWAGVASSQASRELSREEFEYRKQKDATTPNEADKSYSNSINKQLESITKSYVEDLPKKTSNGISSTYYLSPEAEGSVARKGLFDRHKTFLLGTDLGNTQIITKLNEQGFTKKEIQDWMK